MNDMDPLDAGLLPVLSILRRMLANKSPALKSIGWFHVGDELMRFPLDHHVNAALAFVYHQMWRPDLRQGLSEHYQDSTYLLRFGDANNTERVLPGIYWVPLGIYNTFEPNHLFDSPVEKRKNLFGFLGSVNGKPRGQMVDALQNHEQWHNLKDRGTLRVLGRWHDSAVEPPSIYRSMLYHTQYVPCPTGIHYESFRTWEAMEVGAIPVIVEGPEHEILMRLDLGIVVLPSWTHLAPFLLTVTEEETRVRGARVRERYSFIKSALRRHFLRALCQIRPQHTPQSALT
jgi:hypothetical protein